MGACPGPWAHVGLAQRVWPWGWARIRVRLDFWLRGHFLFYSDYDVGFESDSGQRSQTLTSCVILGEFSFAEPLFSLLYNGDNNTLSQRPADLHPGPAHTTQQMALCPYVRGVLLSVVFSA